MKNRVYIILFKDGCLQIYNHKQERQHFQNESRMFEVRDQTPIVLIGDWIGNGYDRHDFKEIKEW